MACMQTVWQRCGRPTRYAQCLAYRAWFGITSWYHCSTPGNVALLPSTEKGDKSPLLQKQGCQVGMQKLSWHNPDFDPGEGLCTVHTQCFLEPSNISRRSDDGNRVDLLLADPLYTGLPLLSLLCNENINFRNFAGSHMSTCAPLLTRWIHQHYGSYWNPVASRKNSLTWLKISTPMLSVARRQMALSLTGSRFLQGSVRAATWLQTYSLNPWTGLWTKQ